LNIAKRSYGLSKTKHFSNALKESSVFGYQVHMCEFIAQKLDDNRIHFSHARKFCSRPTWEVSASEQNRCLASVVRTIRSV